MFRFFNAILTHFRSNDPKTYFTKLFLFLISRSVREESLQDQTIETRFIIFFSIIRCECISLFHLRQLVSFNSFLEDIMIVQVAAFYISRLRLSRRISWQSRLQNIYRASKKNLVQRFKASRIYYNIIASPNIFKCS